MNLETVLVVDDDESIRTFVASVLELDGFEAFQVSADTRVDLVVTDIEMPGMSGRQLVSRLQKSGYTARYLFMTGYFTQNLEGSIPVLRKPFGLEALVRRWTG